MREHLWVEVPERQRVEGRALLTCAHCDASFGGPAGTRPDPPGYCGQLSGFDPQLVNPLNDRMHMFREIQWAISMIDTVNGRDGDEFPAQRRETLYEVRDRLAALVGENAGEGGDR